MSDQRKIGDDNYIRPEITKQDLISSNKDLMREKLKDWVLVPEDYTYRLDAGLRVRYISNKGEYRSGGILIKNGSPEYFVLKNPFKKLTWSVNLRENHIFVEDEGKKNEEKKIKNVLFKLWKDGEIEIQND